LTTVQRLKSAIQNVLSGAAREATSADKIADHNWATPGSVFTCRRVRREALLI
jgi:hypothetical protein